MSGTQGQPVSNLIKVQIILGSAPAQGENVDTMLILGSTPGVIDVVQRMRNYSTLTQVANDYGTTAPEYLAADLWFSQSPQPLTVNIGFWAKLATAGQLIGAPQPTRVTTDFTGITTGAFMIQVDGYYVSVGGMNFSAASNLNGVASIIQAAAQAVALPTATPFGAVLWDGVSKLFKFFTAGTGAGHSIGFVAPPTATGYISFAGQPSPADTVTLNGTAVTFVAGAPSGNQVQIGGSTALTVTALALFLATSTDTQLVKFRNSAQLTGTILSLAAVTAGVGGNSLTLAKSGTNISVSGATLSGGSGTDISALLAATVTSSGAYKADGIAAETALSAVVLIDDLYSNQWYGLALLGGANADYIAVAGYIEGDNVKHALSVTDQEAACLTSNDTTSLMYQLNQLAYNKTSCQYSSTNPYAGVSYLARILTTNWDGNNTTITLQYKVEPGVVGETLSTTQLNNILAKKGNVFIKYNNGTTIIQGAFQCSGQYTDTIIGVDWLAIKLMTDLYNELYTTPTKIPQTDAGMTDLHAVIEADMAAGANNGLLAPGTWTLPGFGALVRGQYLPKGYYIYQPPIGSQSPADRQLRKSVPFQVAGKLGGAVHEADMSLTINQ